MSKFVHVHCDVNEMFQREWPKWILNENPMEWKNNAQKRQIKSFVQNEWRERTTRKATKQTRVEWVV